MRSNLRSWRIHPNILIPNYLECAPTPSQLEPGRGTFGLTTNAEVLRHVNLPVRSGSRWTFTIVILNGLF